MRTHFSWSVWAWLVLSLHAPSALAQADDDADETWYGWQTLTTDGIALTGFLALGLLDESEGAGYGFAALTGFSGYMLGAPLVHVAHANWGAAAGSLALRLVPIASGTAVYTCGDLFNPDKSCQAVWGTIAILTFFLPIALDPALFAYEDAPKREPQLWVATWLDRSGGGITLGDTF